MSRIFLYGSLLDLEHLAIVLGRVPDPKPAHLEGHASFWAKGHNFPMIEARSGQIAYGIALDELSEIEVARLDFYEGPYGYALSDVIIQTATGPEPAQVFMPLPGHYSAGEPWNVADWTKAHGPLAKIAATEIMSRFGVLSGADVARRAPVIYARAQAQVHATTHPSPRILRFESDTQAITLNDRVVEQDKFFLTEELFLTHPRFDGTQTPELARSVFVMADAVTVLPYDPKRDVVLLIEQFRVGCYRRGDPHPWSLEAIAGRIDGGETADETARREAREEAGLEVGMLHLVANYYASPGAVTEYLTSYIAIADLPEQAAGVGGLESENEDIRAMVVPFETLRAAMATGEVENAPLLISALWLAANRDRLRADA